MTSVDSDCSTQLWILASDMKGLGKNGKAEGTSVNFVVTQVYVFITAHCGEAFSGFTGYLNGLEPGFSELS